MIAKLVRQNGYLCISANGVLLPPTACMTYYPNARTYSTFQEAETPIASVGVYAPDRGINDFAGMEPFGPSFWVGEGEYDFSEVDRTFRLIAPTGREAYILPRVYLDCPKWWAERYPEELCRDERGCPQRQSFASERWRRDASAALRALMEHVNQSIWKECVIGYHIACGGTEEWTYHHYTDEQYRLDFSEPNHRAFVRWLRERYGSVERLNAAWNARLSAFEEAEFPTLLERCYGLNGALRDPERERRAIDFWEYTSWLFADTIRALCRTVKEYPQGQYLAGAFYGYIALLTRAEKGHFALSELLRAEEIDFIAATVFASAMDSLNLHDKLFFQEGDVRTCLTRPIRETLPQCDPGNGYFERPAWQPLPSMEASVSAMKSVCARVLTGKMGLWWFDMWGGWFDAPELMGLVGRMNQWMRCRTTQPLRSEVAVIIDERGLMSLPRNDCPAARTIAEQRGELDALGAPYDLYEASDLLEERFPVDQYRLYVLLDFVHPRAELQRAIRTRLRGGGRTLLWGHLSDPQTAGIETEYERFSPPMQGEYEGVLFPDAPVSCPRFTREAREGAYCLASFAGGEQPCVLARQREDCCDVLSLLPALPAALLRQIARMAGVHLYTFGGDVVYAGGNYVGLRALTAGHKRIQLPLPVRELLDAETGRPVPLYNQLYADFTMREGEVRLFSVTG